MTKEEWQTLYNDLHKIYSEFLEHYPSYEKGRNETIRAAARRKVENAIERADYFIMQNPEAFILLTGEHGNDFSRTIIYDEFKKPTYFKNDLGDFLYKINEKIEKQA